MFSLTRSPIDTEAASAPCRRDAAGALATFEGTVRNHHRGKPVERLFYDCYEPMALSEGARILDDAAERFDIHAAVCVHRVGELAIGEAAVFICVSASHRGAAFDACRYIIDEVKERVPIWKREHFADGVIDWVDPTAGGQATP